MEPSQLKQAWAQRGFSYTVWTDPPGQVWKDFVHDVDELVTLVEGEIELSFQGALHKNPCFSTTFCASDASAQKVLGAKTHIFPQ